jgi:hypothetical protein
VRHGAGDAGEEAREPGPRAAGQVEARERLLHRRGRDVDDPAEPPLDHAVDDELDEPDRGGHVRAHPGDEGLVVDLAEVARRGTAVVVDQYVDRGHGRDQALRPVGVPRSTATGMTVAPVSCRISSAVRSSLAASRPLITTVQPARASSVAQPRPSPWLDAQTTAVRPSSPRSMAGVCHAFEIRSASLRQWFRGLHLRFSVLSIAPFT